MKKIKIILFLVLAALPLLGLSQRYICTIESQSYRMKYGTEWDNWSEWQEASGKVVIDLDKNIVRTTMGEGHEYDLYAYEGEESDGHGGEVHVYKMMEEDGDFGTLSLRLGDNFQVYIRFGNIQIVYNIGSVKEVNP